MALLHRRSKSAVSLVEFSWDPLSGQARQVRPGGQVGPSFPLSSQPPLAAQPPPAGTASPHLEFGARARPRWPAGARAAGAPGGKTLAGPVVQVWARGPWARDHALPAPLPTPLQRSPAKTRSMEGELAAGGAAPYCGAAGPPGCSPCGVASAAASTASQPSSATSSLAAQLAELQVASRQSSGSDLGDRGRLLAGLPPGLAPLHTRRASAGSASDDGADPGSPPDSACSPQQVGAIRSFDSAVLRTLTPIKTRSRPGSARAPGGDLPPSPPAPVAGSLVSPFSDCPSAGGLGSGLRPKLAAGRALLIHSRGGSTSGGAPNAYNPYDLTAAALSTGAQPGGWLARLGGPAWGPAAGRDPLERPAPPVLQRSGRSAGIAPACATAPAHPLHPLHPAAALPLLHRRRAAAAWTQAPRVAPPPPPRVPLAGPLLAGLALPLVLAHHV